MIVNDCYEFMIVIFWPFYLQIFGKIGKSTMENLSGKYNQRVLNNKKEEATDTLKTASKKDNLKSS